MEPNPYDTASWCSLLFFKWTKIYVDDTSFTSEPPHSLKAEDHYKALKQAWRVQLHKDKPSFFRALVSAYGKLIFMDTVPFVGDIVAQVSMGLLIGYLIEFIQDYSGDDLYIGFLYALGIAVCLSVSFMSRHLSFLKGQFRRSVWEGDKPGFDGRRTDGNNHDSRDCRSTWSLRNAHHLASRASSTRINKLNTKLRVKVSTQGDQRVKETTEIIEGIRVLKMYGWEEAYSRHIMQARNSEVKMNRTRVCIRGSNMTLFLVAQGLAVFVTFSGFLIFDQEVQAKDIFTVLSLFVSAQYYLTIIFPFATELVSTYLGSCQRLGEYLMQEEYEPIHEDYHRGEIKLENVTARYAEPKEGEEEQLVLNGVNARFPRGELTFVVGEVGSGKTSLLLSILGEIYKTGGTVYRSGKISYIEQEPWILSGTLRENITLGRAENLEKMQRILECTGLAKT